jgi:hypothetical protein
MTKGNEAFSRIIIDAQLKDQGWNTHEMYAAVSLRSCCFWQRSSVTNALGCCLARGWLPAWPY